MTRPLSRFPSDTHAPNVIRAALTLLQADYEQRLARLQDIRAGHSSLTPDTLAEIWLRLKARCENEELAFRLLIQTIVAELEDNPTTP